MSALSYTASEHPVRRDVEEAHQRAWVRVARAGTWWTGRERVAIAQETRNARICRLCAQRKRALSPFSLTGAHDSDASLPEPIIDLAHRISTDPGRLSRKWFESLLAAGIDDARYVEALGVSVRTVAIDMFCMAIGVAVHRLPEAQPGEPSRERPATLVDDGFWVTVQPQGAELYGGGTMPNVGRALSLVPEEVHAVLDIMPSHYVPMAHVPDPAYDPGRSIDRVQMELIAARVSALNECFY